MTRRQHLQGSLEDIEPLGESAVLACLSGEGLLEVAHPQLEVGDLLLNRDQHLHLLRRHAFVAHGGLRGMHCDGYLFCPVV